jgi:hypothetical protein
MDNRTWLGWTLLVAGLLWLIVLNQLELLSILLPFSIVLSCGVLALMSKKSDGSTGLKKR